MNVRSSSRCTPSMSFNDFSASSIRSSLSVVRKRDQFLPNSKRSPCLTSALCCSVTSYIYLSRFLLRRDRLSLAPANMHIKIHNRAGVYVQDRLHHDPSKRISFCVVIVYFRSTFPCCECCI